MAPKVTTVSLAEFAEDHSCTVRTVTNWIQAGMPHRKEGSTRRIVRSEANAWVKARDAEAAKAARPKEETLSESERRYEQARAEKLELEVERMRGHLVTVEEAAATVEARLAQWRTQMVTLPQRWAPAVLGCKTLVEVTAKLDQAVGEAMTTLSEGA